MPGPPSWIIEKTGLTVSTVPPNALVRVLLRGAVVVSAEIEVFSIAEFVIRRILHRIMGRPGRQETTLQIDPSHVPAQGVGALSTAWYAADVQVGPKPARFVARTDGFPISTPLRVASEVVYEFENPKLSVGLDLSLAGPALGLPVPTPVTVEAIQVANDSLARPTLQWILSSE